MTVRAARSPALASALAGVAVLAGTFGAARAQERPRFGTVTTVAAPRDHAIRGAVMGDIDADGRDDLLLMTRRPGRRMLRTLRVHLRRAGDTAFAAEPDATLELYDDVTAFAIADVDPEPGAEVVLFTANAVHAWRPRAADDRRIVRLLEASFLYQFPDPKEAFAFDAAVRDVDGDGLADLVVPEPDGYRVAIQRRADGVSRFDPPSFLRVPDDAAGETDETMGQRRMRAKAAKKEIKIALQFGGDAVVSGDLLSVSENVPAPQVADFDGDGLADVLAQTPHQLHVWRQRGDHTFTAAPDASYDLPVVADRQRRFDVSYSALTADVDGDARADCVMFAGDRNSSAVRTQILVFTHKGGSAASPLFGEKGIPRQLLVVAGFAGTPRLADVDGDGRPDLTMGSMRVDGLDALGAATKGTLDAELYVYLNRGGTFSRTPDVTWPVELKAEGMKFGKEALLARFIPDVTGDGVRELLLRDDPARLRLFMLRRAGDGLQPLEQALFETVLTPDARVVVTGDAAAKGRAKKAPEILVIEDTQVRHVRFP